MKTPSFFERLKKFGLKNIILSPDTFVAIITFFLVGIFSNWSISIEKAVPILNIFIQVSSGLFAIVLAGLAIVTSFTDKDFVYVWVKAGEFENIITLFQINLFTPIIILVLSILIRFVFYSNWIMIILIALFAYLIVSLLDLINFISKYGLQRAKFVQILKEQSPKKKLKR